MNCLQSAARLQSRTQASFEMVVVHRLAEVANNPVV